MLKQVMRTDGSLLRANLCTHITKFPSYPAKHSLIPQVKSLHHLLFLSMIRLLLQ
jgi:hypothetical protein